MFAEGFESILGAGRSKSAGRWFQGRNAHLIKSDKKHERNEESEKYFENHLKYEYDHEIESGADWRGDLDALTDEANRKKQLLKDIVKSFNRDCSNGMVDYFDRAFYDSYKIKVVD